MYIVIMALLAELGSPPPFPHRPPGPLPPVVTPPPLPRSHSTVAPAPSSIAVPAQEVGPTDIFTDAAYPADARRRREQGTAAIALDVDEFGRVTSCSVTRSSGSNALDAASCRLMSERSRFRAARNRDGRAVGSVVHRSVRWHLPSS
jgi:protein TonB